MHEWVLRVQRVLILMFFLVTKATYVLILCATLNGEVFSDAINVEVNGELSPCLHVNVFVLYSVFLQSSPVRN